MPLPKTWTTVTPLSKTIAMLLFILFPFIGFSAGMRYQQRLDHTDNYIQHVAPKPTINQNQTNTDIWKEYTYKDWGFSIKLPQTYKIEEKSDKIKFTGSYSDNFTAYPNFTLKNKFTDFKNYPSCEINKDKVEADYKLPCLSNIAWKQIEPFAKVFFNNNQATSIYYTLGIDGDFHSVQFDQSTKLQFDAYVAGGGLDERFKKIVQTITLIDSKNEEQQSVCTQDAMQCSNGVWVGRSGANCEFVCPK